MIRSILIGVAAFATTAVIILGQNAALGIGLFA
jgi:hypothetical protein